MIINPQQSEIEAQFTKVGRGFKEHFNKVPDLNGMLFLIGIQELGKGLRTFSKEEKQDLMHIANCKVLSYGGYYTLDGQDTEGWPIWIPANPLPFLSLEEQELMLKMYVVQYVETELGWEL